MINGLLTLRGAWHKLRTDPVIKFFAAGITFYGMATFEGPLLSIKSVNALAHYTDWIIAHVHTGALGWNGFLTFGMIYWLLPRLFQAELYSKKLAEIHFWVATFGILLYVVAIYSAGVTQGLMWRAFDETGRLAYPDFVETVMKLMPMYWMRAVGGSLYIVGMVLFGYNILMTWRRRPATYDVPVIQAPRLAREYVPTPGHGAPVPASSSGWARFVASVRPLIRPAACGSQYGAPSPLKAGTRQSPAASAVDASAAADSASSPNRSAAQRSVEPAARMLPSNASSGPWPASHATVKHRPGGTRPAPSVSPITDEPVPIVALTAPGA
jgi:hypothetical protein